MTVSVAAQNFLPSMAPNNPLLRMISGKTYTEATYTSIGTGTHPIERIHGQRLVEFGTLNIICWRPEILAAAQSNVSTHDLYNGTLVNYLENGDKLNQIALASNSQDAIINDTGLMHKSYTFASFKASLDEHVRILKPNGSLFLINCMDYRPEALPAPQTGTTQYVIDKSQLELYAREAGLLTKTSSFSIIETIYPGFKTLSLVSAEALADLGGAVNDAVHTTTSYI